MAVNINGTGSITGLSSISSPGISGVPVGSESAPAFSFTGDTNTGIYSPGADQVAVSTGGTGRLFINSSGQVGIGGSPAYMLDITTGAFNDVARFTGYNAGTLLFRNSSTDLCEIRAESGDSLAIGAGGTERLRITSAGLVGIGTNSPTSAKLDVRDDVNYPVRWGSTSAQFGELSYETGSCIIGATSGNKLTLRSAGTAAITVDTSQRVGIGTTAPGSYEASANNLVVADSGNGGITIATGTSSYGSIYFADGTTATDKYRGVVEYNHSNNAMAFWTDATERLRIDSSGRVGIGTSSPDAGSVLHVKGQKTTFESASGGSGFYLTGTDASGFPWRIGHLTTVQALQFSCNSASSQMSLDSSGRLGIGTTSMQTRLHVKSNTANYAGGLFLESSANDTGAFLFHNGTNTILESSYVSSGSYTPIAFHTNNFERARIDTSGRLLVGTSTARSNFELGTPTVQHETAVSNFNQGLSIVNNGGSAGYSPSLTLGVTRGTSTGSNTAIPGADYGFGRIDFAGADGTNLITGARIQALTDGTPGTNDMPGRLVFSTTADGASSPTEHLRINEKGTFHFSTNGSYTAASGAYNEIYQTNNNVVALYSRHTNTNPYGYQIFYDVATNNTANEFLYCSDISALRLAIRSNGGISNFQANNVNLSDINSKKDISPAADTWECIKEWEIVNYRYKDQPDDADLNLGVIAQQVAENCPEVITIFQEAKPATEDRPAQEERLGVKEQQMYWMAIKALQEAIAKIETLEGMVAVNNITIDEQQHQLSTLAARLTALESA
jgi:uncharacterized coiled-coil protein SlyX